MIRKGKKPHSWFEVDTLENRISELRIKKGLTLSSLANLCDCSVGALVNMALGYTNPLQRNGDRRLVAVKICEVLGKDFEDVFPLDFCKISVDNIEPVQLLGSLHAELVDEIEMLEARRSILFACRSLSKRQWSILVMHAVHEMTLPEIGATVGLSTERIRQILAKIFRNLRHPEHYPYLQEAQRCTPKR